MTEILTDKQISFNTDLKNFKLRAGRYLVVDPCYVFGDDDALWSKICDAFYPNDDNPKEWKRELVMSVDNDKVYMFGTNSGDGVYPVYQDHSQIGSCGVDAGLLSFIPKEVVDEIDCSLTRTGGGDLGTWVDIDDDYKVKYEDGDVSVANLFVDTSFSNPDYNDDDGYYDSDDDYDDMMTNR